MGIFAVHHVRGLFVLCCAVLAEVVVAFSAMPTCGGIRLAAFIATDTGASVGTVVKEWDIGPPDQGVALVALELAEDLSDYCIHRDFGRT